VEWAEFYKPMADIIEARVAGDWSGKTELTTIFGEDAANVSAIKEWHNYDSCRNSIDDQEEYKTMHPFGCLVSLL
jgi:hypothetical protein